MKTGVLVTEGKFEASVAAEVYQRGRLSLDAITTLKRAGIGAAFDLVSTETREIDAGVYLTQAFGESFAPKVGVGVSMRF